MPDITNRGFVAFDEFETKRHRWRIVESSVEFEGPHVRIFATKKFAGLDDQHVHIPLSHVDRIINALVAFKEEALAGRLTEPPEREMEPSP